MGLLRTLLFILVAYYILRLLSRWLAPKLFGYAARKAEAHFRDAYGWQGPKAGQEETQVGEVIVEKKGKTNKKDSEEIGEYIEFEEIE